MLYDKRWERPQVQPQKTEPWRDTLRRAADILETRGLAKFTQCDSQGRVCLHGAISLAAHGETYLDTSVEDYAVYNYLIGMGVDPNLTSPTGSAYWNNQPERTKEEVVAALKGAAES